YKRFDKNKFIQLVLDKNWKNKELKERMHHISFCLNETLPKDYPEALQILKKIAPSFKGFDAMVFPDYVECYGLDYPKISLPALVLFTKCCSSEFAIRPFLIKNSNSTMEYMNKWAGDKHPSVRRLASEGCRPRLPWAMALPEFKEDPRPIIPILEKLIDDESESVRRSVANNLNDISKDNPDLALEICERWYGQSKDVNWVVKHAARDMLKSGNKRALLLFGFGDVQKLDVKKFSFNKNVLTIGEILQFSFDLNIKTQESCKIRLEYAVDYVKSKGKMSRKIFQIRESCYNPGKHTIKKKHSFLDHSTRKHYPGTHFISVIVNGEEKCKKPVILESTTK
ncbi:DNA alkylation repair protein, partial [Bacteroidota bacterium]